MKNKKEAIAVYLMLDLSEVSDYRYHYGHTTIPVYAIDDCYYCATKGTEKPAKHRYNMEFNWIEVIDTYVNSYGFKIYKSQFYETNNN